MVLGEMRTAGQLATLAGCGTNEIRRDLDQWAADGRILSVRQAFLSWDVGERMIAMRSLRDDRRRYVAGRPSS